MDSKFAIRSFVFWFVCFSTLCGTLAVCEEVSGDIAIEEPSSGEVIPYTKVCFINYGFTMDFHMGAKQTFQQGEGRFNSSTKNDGTAIDLRDDLGLARSSADFFIGVDFNIYAFRLSFDYTRSLFDGERNLAQNITVDGTTYSVNSLLKSDLTMDWMRWILGYSLYNSPSFAFGLDLAFDLVRIKYNFTGTSLSTSNTVNEEDEKYLPLLKPGIHMDFSWTEPLIFTLTLNGIVYKQSSVLFESVYVELSGRWYFSDSFFLFLQGAYDYQRVESEMDDSFAGELKFNTWFASGGLGLSF